MSDSSFSLTTFNPSGKLVQIEHALAAVNAQGRAALGVKARNGVILATERRGAGITASVLIDDSVPLRKIEVIDDHVGCVYAGMPADYRVVLSRARKEAQRYVQVYGQPIPVQALVREVANVMQEFTQSGGVRPFGVSLLIAGWDRHRRFQLYQVDPSGAYFAWKATALGKGALNAKTFLEKRHSDSVEIEDATHIALLTLKETFENQMDETTVELGGVTLVPTEDGGEKGVFRVFPASETLDYLNELE